MYLIFSKKLFDKNLKNENYPNGQFHCVTIDGDLLCFVVHSDRALHIFIKLIFGKPKQYAENQAMSQITLSSKLRI